MCIFCIVRKLFIFKYQRDCRLFITFNINLFLIIIIFLWVFRMAKMSKNLTLNEGYIHFLVHFPNVMKPAYFHLLFLQTLCILEIQYKFFSIAKRNFQSVDRFLRASNPWTRQIHSIFVALNEARDIKTALGIKISLFFRRAATSKFEKLIPRVLCVAASRLFRDEKSENENPQVPTTVVASERKSFSLALSFLFCLDDNADAARAFL